VADLLVDHRVPFHTQDIAIAFAGERLRDSNRLGPGNRLDGRAGSHVSQQGEFDRAAGASRGNEFDRTAPVPGAADEAFLLQVAEVFVYRRQWRGVEPAADFLEAGSVTVLLDEVVEVVQNLALALREREHGHPPMFSGLE